MHPRSVLEEVIVLLKVTSQINYVCNYWAKVEMSMLILPYCIGQPEVCVVHIVRSSNSYILELAREMVGCQHTCSGMQGVWVPATYKYFHLYTTVAIIMVSKVYS